MSDNSLIYGLIFGLILAPGFIALQLKIFSLLIKLLKLNLRFNKPITVLSLIIAELITAIFLIKPILFTPNFYSIVVIVLLSIKIYGLWKLKKWVIYVYLSLIILPLLNGGLFGPLGIKDIKLNIVTLISQSLILLVYYLYVYKPNKKSFK